VFNSKVIKNINGYLIVFFFKIIRLFKIIKGDRYVIDVDEKKIHKLTINDNCKLSSIINKEYLPRWRCLNYERYDFYTKCKCCKKMKHI